MVTYFNDFFRAFAEYVWFIPLIVLVSAPAIIIGRYLYTQIDLTRHQWLKIYWSEVCAQISGFIVILGLCVYFI